MRPQDPQVLRDRYYRDKAVWRKRVKRVVEIADGISKRHMTGDYISMGAIYEGARKVFETGKRGVFLRHRMDDYAIIRRDRVHESFASTCKLLEAVSAVLKKIAEKQGTPFDELPVFVSELAATSSVELGAQDALKQLMEDVE